MSSTPSHKNDVTNGFGKKAQNGFNSSGKGNFGFGQFRNQRNFNMNTQQTDDSSENEDDQFTPPMMEVKPELAKPELRPKRNPLDDLRSSFDSRKTQTFLSGASTYLENGRISKRDDMLARSTRNFSELKLVSLKERRSISRGFKIQPIQKPVESNNLLKYTAQQTEVVIEKPDECLPIVPENDKYETLAMLTKLMTGLLSKIDEDPNIQHE